MSDNWLQSYLIESVREKRCTRIHCTTCGAVEFRHGIFEALSKATGRQPPERRTRAIEVVKALTGVTRLDYPSHALEEAIRCILFEIWSGIPMSVEEIESSLAGTWSGNVLTRMREHHASREAARRARQDDEDLSTFRREEKKRVRQERHQQRLALQRDRSRAWHESHGKRD